MKDSIVLLVPSQLDLLNSFVGLDSSVWLEAALPRTAQPAHINQLHTKKIVSHVQQVITVQRNL